MWTPCEVPVEEFDEKGKLVIKHKCPYCEDENDYVDCRNMCGLGVDE